MHLLAPKVGATGCACSPAPRLAACRGRAGWMLDPDGGEGRGGSEGEGEREREGKAGGSSEQVAV